MPRRVHEQYSGGVIRHKPNRILQAEFNLFGRRMRRHFREARDARRWLDLRYAEYNGRIAHPSAQDVADAQKARKILPEGVSVMDAARYYMEQHQRPVKAGRKRATRRT